MNPMEKDELRELLVIIFKFIGVYLGLIGAGYLVWAGKDIANTLFVLVSFMIRDLYRSETGKKKNANP